MGILTESAEREKQTNVWLEQIANTLKSGRSGLDGDYTVVKRSANGLIGYDFRLVRKDDEFLADYMARVKLETEALEKLVKEQTNVAAVLRYQQTRRRGIDKKSRDIDDIMGDNRG